VQSTRRFAVAVLFLMGVFFLGVMTEDILAEAACLADSLVGGKGSTCASSAHHIFPSIHASETTTGGYGGSGRRTSQPADLSGHTLLK